MGSIEEKETHADVVFMGGAKVGKTALVHRLLQIEPSTALEGRYKPTIEDSYVREFLVGEKRCRLRVVDTAGGYTFPAMQQLWAKRASAFVLVCSRDQEGSILQIKNIINQIQDVRRVDVRKLLVVIVVNKCDLHMKDWVVSDDDVELLADEYQISGSSIVFTSAFAEVDITQIFKSLWQQNEALKEQGLKFEQRSEQTKPIRRFSAFAVLFGNHMKTSVAKPTQPQKGRPYAGSFSGTMLPGTQRFIRGSRDSPNWLAKTFGRMNFSSNLKANTRPKRDSLSTVIDMSCNIS